MKTKIKVTLAMVVSLDGKSTKGEIKNQSWASKEDQKYFQFLIASNNLIVMGRKTYETAKTAMRLEEVKLRVVLTQNPKKFKTDNVAGQLEFSKESPLALLKRLEKAGYKKMLLVSGSAINTLFFKARLIDEIWLTVEPKIFGSGNNMVDNIGLDVQLHLESVKKLNKNGTLLLKYKVVK
jgi:dihydrofolate reductase